MGVISHPQPTEPAGLLWQAALAARQSPTNREGHVSMDDPVITMLDPRAVVIPPRLRPEDPAHTAALVESVRRSGVRTPIEVRNVAGDLVLIAGLHRLAASIQVGLSHVPAIIRAVTDDEAELLEIEENLIRHDLNALDRAVFTARWKEVYERLNPTSLKRGRKSSQAETIAFSRSAEAKKVGLSRASIERYALRIRRLAPGILPRLAGTDAALKGSVLDALGKLDHDAQRAVVAQCESRGGTIAAAIRLHRQHNAAPVDAKAEEDLMFARALTAWTKWPAGVQRRLLAHIGAVVAPRAVTAKAEKKARAA